MGTKKVYAEVVSFLEANENALVRDIMPKVKEITKKEHKRSSFNETYIIDNNKTIKAIRCNILKRWCPLVGEKAVDFSRNPKTTSGYKPASKAGCSLQSRARGKADRARKELLAKVISKEIPVDAIEARKLEIEAERLRIPSPECFIGFESKQEVVQYLEQNGIVVVEETVS